MNFKKSKSFTILVPSHPKKFQSQNDGDRYANRV